MLRQLSSTLYWVSILSCWCKDYKDRKTLMVSFAKFRIFFRSHGFPRRQTNFWLIMRSTMDLNDPLLSIHGSHLGIWEAGKKHWGCIITRELRRRDSHSSWLTWTLGPLQQDAAQWQEKVLHIRRKNHMHTYRISSRYKSRVCFHCQKS